VLEAIAAAVRAGRIKTRAVLNRRVGRAVNRRKVGKHFAVDVAVGTITWQRRPDRIDDEARLDGICVIRTRLDAEALATDAAVLACKNLPSVERALRKMKLSRLEIRPIHVCATDHVRAPVFLGMRALCIEWPLRPRLAPILCEDDDREGARASPVEPAQVSSSTKAKAGAKRMPDGSPGPSMTTLLADLATLTLNTVTLAKTPDRPVHMMATPTRAQCRAFDLLDIDPAHHVAMQVTG